MFHNRWPMGMHLPNSVCLAAILMESHCLYGSNGRWSVTVGEIVPAVWGSYLVSVGWAATLFRFDCATFPVAISFLPMIDQVAR